MANAKNHSIEAIELSNENHIKTLIGSETIESDAVGSAGDRLFFDEECFIRGTSGRFQIDTLIPVAGKGVIAGTAADGTTLSDVLIGIDELRNRTSFQ